MVLKRLAVKALLRHNVFTKRKGNEMSEVGYFRPMTMEEFRQLKDGDIFYAEVCGEAYEMVAKGCMYFRLDEETYRPYATIDTYAFSVPLNCALVRTEGKDE